MSFTAEEYRTAAKVARLEGGLDYTAEDWEAEADRLDSREQYTAGLGYEAYLYRGASSLRVGEKLIAKLKQDGWTPPEGLL